MGKFKDQYSGFEDAGSEAQKKSFALPSWPKACTVPGCNEDTSVVHIVVRDQLGRLCSGYGGRFTHYKHGGGVALDHGYGFIRWETRCAWHQTETTRKVERRGELTPAAYTPQTAEEKHEYLHAMKSTLTGYTSR